MIFPSSCTYLSILLKIIIIYFFTTLVILPKSYSVGIIFAIIGFFLFLLYLAQNRKKIIIHQDYYPFIIAFVCYFLFYLLDFILHNDPLKILDAPSRSIFFLFIFFLLQFYPLKITTLIYSIPLGGIATGIYAFYQKFFLHYDRALSDTTYVIQSGDMAMSLGVFSFALIFYCLQRKEHFYTLFCAIGSLGGMLGSFLSLTRGGWLLMPFIVVILFILNRKALSKKIIISFLSALLLIFVTLLITPSSKVLSQIERAKIEVANFGKEDNADTSVGARLELWKASWISIQEKPIFGWGYTGAKEERKKQGEQGILAKFPASLGHAHNQYINDTLERGVIGLFSLLGIFLLPLYQYFKAYRESRNNLEVKTLATLGIIHITSVMSYGLTQVFFAHNSGNMFYFFLTVLFYAMLLENKKQQKI